MQNAASGFVLLGLLLCASAAFEEADATAIIEKAVRAHGGEAKLAKLRSMRIKLEGTTYPGLGQPNVPCTIELFWQTPNQSKSSFSFKHMDRMIKHIQVTDGAKGWSRLNDDMTENLPKGHLEEIREQNYVEDLGRLDFLRDKGVELSILSEIRIGDRPAVGVLVKSKGRRDVKLYFDKASGYLVKREHRRFESGAGDGYLEEVIFSGYQEKDDLKHYMRIIVFADGEKTLDASVTEIEFFKKLDAKVFSKP